MAEIDEIMNYVFDFVTANGGDGDTASGVKASQDTVISCVPGSNLFGMSGSLKTGKYGPLVGAIDQGTSSSRFLVFAANTSELITFHQVEVRQIFPQEGWCEEDPMEIVNSVRECIVKTVDKLKAMEVDPADIKAVGVCNQRESTVLWDKYTGKPYCNAVIWLDNRTAGTVEEILDNVPGHDKDVIKDVCGLPISTYFSALKIRWLMDNDKTIQEHAQHGPLVFGTVDTWLMYNLIGDIHVTDVSNAARTMLMNLQTLKWDEYLCNFFGIPSRILPEIRSSSEVYGVMKDGPLKGIPIAGCLGDQSAALVGQMCFRIGQAKCTYGTGCFLLCNTGMESVKSKRGLLSTVAYQMGPKAPICYAVEGSVAIAGAVIRWLRDNLNIVKAMDEVEKLAASVESSHDVYFVPAFSGLYAPYWEPDARGLICGLTQFSTKAHITRAALEAVCFQVKEILDCMYEDINVQLDDLLVDGGMTSNNLLMQCQSDILGMVVIRPQMLETSALGAAMVAGRALGIWDLERSPKAVPERFVPNISPGERRHRVAKWKEAVKRSQHWQSVTPRDSMRQDMGQQWFRLSSLPIGLFGFVTFGMFLVSHLLQK